MSGRAPTQLVALDVDGTIVDRDDHLADRVRDAVAGLVAAGVRVVVATGRSVAFTTPVLDRLSLVEGYAVSSNGAVTLRLDPSVDGGFAFDDVVTFDPAPALQLLREHLPTAVFAVEEARRGFRLSSPFPDGELVEPWEVVGFDRLLHEPVSRVVVRSPEHTPEDFLRLVERAGLHGVSYAVGWSAWLDIAPDGVSKASALERVRRRLGVDPGATMAVGDGRNDLEMLRWAARGIAMGQAPEEVRAAADEVTAPVEEDGLAAVLEDVLAAVEEQRRAG